MLSYGIGENVNFIWRLLACYVTSVTVIIVALIIMIMIFDLIIGLLLNFQIFLKSMMTFYNYSIYIMKN